MNVSDSGAVCVSVSLIANSTPEVPLNDAGFVTAIDCATVSNVVEVGSGVGY